MSVVPIMYDFASQMDKFTNRVLSDDFGFVLFPHNIFQMNQPPRSFFHPLLVKFPFEQLRHIAALRDDKEMMTVDQDGFQVSFDVNQFKPNEITVKTVNNYIEIEGNHQEREDDYGFIQRHFIRKYLLPTGYNHDEVVSTISSNGILSVKVHTPRQNAVECKERIIKIQETGAPSTPIKNTRIHGLI